VPLWMAGADAAVELKRAESDKEESRENVDQREDWVTGEDIIGGCELSEDRIPGCGWGVIAVEHDGDEMDSTARDDCNADYDQEDRRGPEELAEAPHIGDTYRDQVFFPTNGGTEPGVCDEMAREIQCGVPLREALQLPLSGSLLSGNFRMTLLLRD